nr:S8 family serine peptidase [Streptomyces sp. NBC_00830]
MTRRSLRFRRQSAAALLTAAATALPLLIGASPAQALPAPDPVAPTALQSKAENKVVDRLDDKDTATFWVNLSGEADTTAARRSKAKDKAARLYEAKTAYAKKSQAGLRALLDEADADYRTYWIANTVKVTADKALAEKIAARSDVTSIEADDPILIPDPIPGEDEPSVNAVEWNVDRINAPKVWSELGVRGEGVVVANIDTGVQYDHPALKAGYRGLKADGSYDHAYNWFDPAKICSGTAPCDNNGHGTHTMGTMVGDDGGTNQVGVAPGAKWIAAKGCESGSCSQASLLAAGQWVVAPTDAAGQNPRPDLAPDIVNNSWGANVYDAWYRTVVQSWRDAGIFPAFSNGNNGPGCNTAGSPGSYTNSYASGAFDINNAIASFSSRGTGESGSIKPNIAAPGASIRSSYAGGGYSSLSGTSMASPHTAATVALMWSASPAIAGNVTETEKLLNSSAIDVDSTACGGTAANNNVFGEGRLDAYAAVSATPRGPLGAVSGTVTAAGTALADATVSFDGPMKATVNSAADGSYGLPKLMVGDYKLSVAKFGYVTTESTVTVVEGATATKDFVLAEAPSATVTGRVLSSAGPEAGATVVAQNTPVQTTSAADGSYSLRLPQGTYNLAVTPAGACASATSVTIGLSGDLTRDITLADRKDTFGYACAGATAGEFPTGTEKLTFSSTTTGSAVMNLPFAVPLYGKGYSKATATTEGVLAFGTSSTSSLNGTLPTTGSPNGALYPLWDNMTIDASAGVYWATAGTAPHRKLIVEWRDALVIANSGRATFSAAIGEDGVVSYHYKTVPGSGATATVGQENATGTDAFLYSFNSATIQDGSTITFRTTDYSVVAGKVVDANDKEPLEGATVTVGTDTATTAANGAYALQLPVSAEEQRAVEISATRYQTATASADLEPGGITVTETALKTPLVTAAAKAYELVVPAEQRRSRTLELANSGTDSAYEITTKATADWITLPPAGTIGAGGTATIPLAFDTTGATPGTVLRATLVLTTGSGRTPVVEIPVTVAVPAYQAALDTGAKVNAMDTLGDTWGPDQAFTQGSYGYLGSASVLSTKKAIGGTDNQALYQTARQGMYEYRFDGLPSGTYRIELGFAELSSNDSTDRVFDVMAEGTQYVPNLDLALEAGVQVAHNRTITVEVTDGQLNLRFVANAGKTLVNSIRVSERPDLTS